MNVIAWGRDVKGGSGVEGYEGKIEWMISWYRKVGELSTRIVAEYCL